ncbi:MAG: rRNA adenine N-6-methyltransferase family protein [Hyphomicrobiales bacterium]
MPIAFLEVVKALQLPDRADILDVGAGGFAGANTTVHLLKLKDPKIDAIELDSERAKALADKFAGKINVISGDFLTHEFGKAYDLVVLDLDSNIIPALYESWLPGKVKSLLKPGGAVVVLCFGYAPDVPNDSYGLALEIQVVAKAFLQRHFRATSLTPAVVKAFYDADPDYAFVTMLGKSNAWRQPETIVWIGLRRR